VIWALVHASGVHATVAGVALGLLVPVTVAGPGQSPAEHLEHLLRPLSAGLAVPAFALLSAGITISAATLQQVFTGRAGIGILAGLVAGKAAGVFGGAYVTARFTRGTLSPGLTWSDVFAVAVLSGIGFTVSLLISDLAFGADSAGADIAKTAVVLASVIASLLACGLLGLRNKHYRTLQAEDPAGPAS
jgi:NhaA family Na+:H+ antiporter